MLSDELKRDLWEILCYYGREHQLRNKLPEEMKELAEALVVASGGTTAVRKALEQEHIFEELADVYIVLSQIVEALRPEEEALFNAYVRYKIARQLMRIETERFEKDAEKEKSHV